MIEPADRARLKLLDGLLVLLILISAALVFGHLGWLSALEPVALLVAPLVWVAALTIAAWGAGAPTWRLIHGRQPTDPAEAVLSLALGSAVLMACAGLLAAVGLLFTVPLYVVFGIAAAAGGVSLYRIRPKLQWGRVRGWPWLLILLAAALSAVAATCLSPFYDQWHYHLGVPFQSLRIGRLWATPDHAYSMLSANMGLLYAYALAGPGAWAAQLTHWWMGGLAAAASAVLAHRLVPGSGPIAAAILVCTPAVYEMATVAGADLAVAAYCACAWLAVLMWREHRGSPARWELTIGVLIGVAVGCKYLAIATVAVPLAVALLFLAPVSRGAGGRAAAVAAVALAAIVVTAPWGARNTARTGNPVYPYLSAAFGVDGGTNEISLGIGDFSPSDPRLASAATLGTFERLGFAGRPGPVYLWLLPLWLVTTLSRGAPPLLRGLLASFVVGVALWGIAPAFGRYLIPLLVLGAAGISVAWYKTVEHLPPFIRGVLTVLLASVLLANLNPFRGDYIDEQLGVALGLSPPEAVLRKYVSHWDAIHVINESLPPSATILLVAESRAYGIDRDIVVQDPITRPFLSRLAETSRTADEMVQSLRARGITHVLINTTEARRIARLNNRQTYFDLPDPAAVHRIERFVDHKLTPVWRGPGLRLLAVPRPHEASGVPPVGVRSDNRFFHDPWKPRRAGTKTRADLRSISGFDVKFRKYYN